MDYTQVKVGQRLACLSPLLARVAVATVIDTTRAPWVLVQCCETGFVYLANPPRYEDLVEAFAWQNSFREERARRRQAEPVVARMSEIFKMLRARLFARREKCFELARRFLAERSEISLLDVGCGRGRLGISLAQRFAQIGTRLTPYGIEISSRLAEDSHQQFARFGGRVISAPAILAAETTAAETYDLVVLCSLLEHEHQPLRLLRALHGTVKAEGIVVIKVPNYGSWMRYWRGRNWCGYRFPDHVNYFTASTLDQLARAAGFRIAFQSWREKNPLSDSLYAVLGKDAAHGGWQDSSAKRSAAA
jgi:2-polyprenyl-3-methyl-5-hydroxy-6-metoxy-1,4-benzoquinol methylase